MEERKCRVCGCTEYNACEGACYWVTEDLCSACVGKEYSIVKRVYETLGCSSFYRAIHESHVDARYIERILFSEDQLVVMLPPNKSGCLCMVVQPYKDCDDCEIAFLNNFYTKLSDAPVYYSGEDIFNVKGIFEHLTGIKVEE